MSTKTPYWQKLQDPRWQKKRLEILERDGWKCRECDNAEETLHVHHRYYVSDREPWDYPEWAYSSLCKTCHEREKIIGPELQHWELILDCFQDLEDIHFLTDDVRCEQQLGREGMSKLLHAVMKPYLPYQKVEGTAK